MGRDCLSKISMLNFGILAKAKKFRQTDTEEDLKSQKEYYKIDMSIPMIIHQTWKTSDIPEIFQKYQQTWMTNHPGWEYRFYNDHDCRQYVKKKYPELLELYDHLPRQIQRIDIFRYLVIKKEGGLYADIDMECLRPMTRLFSGRNCLFSIEAHLTTQRQKELGYPEPYQIGNCIFASEPSHWFFNTIIDRITRLSGSSVRDDKDVEDTTGPRMLTRLYYELDEDRKADIAILRQIHLMPPLEYPNIFPFNLKMYARHHNAGTWKTGKSSQSLKRRWIERNRLPSFW